MRLSIRTWKKIITIVVLAIIAFLLMSLIVFAFKYEAVLRKFDALEDLWEGNEHGDGLFQQGEEMNYTQGYPSLYVDFDFAFQPEDSSQKVCYLTFNGGPSISTTSDILDILKEYDVKATFFVVYADREEELMLYQRMAIEGHSIGILGVDNDNVDIYQSVDAYLTNFEKLSKHIESIVDVHCEILRFPGGSINAYNGRIYQQLIGEMIRRGYVYYDWDVSGGTWAETSNSASEIISNVVDYVGEGQKNIILLDEGQGNEAVVEALPQIIQSLQQRGYVFEALNHNVKPVVFGY